MPDALSPLFCSVVRAILKCVVFTSISYVFRSRCLFPVVSSGFCMFASNWQELCFFFRNICRTCAPKQATALRNLRSLLNGSLVVSVIGISKEEGGGEV